MSPAAAPAHALTKAIPGVRVSPIVSAAAPRSADVPVSEIVAAIAYALLSR
jgi:hypothetical protein